MARFWDLPSHLTSIYEYPKAGREHLSAPTVHTREGLKTGGVAAKTTHRVQRKKQSGTTEMTLMMSGTTVKGRSWAAKEVPGVEQAGWTAQITRCV